MMCRHASGLLHPADTVMDLNIGAALWLAARAEGRVRLVGAGTPALQAASPGARCTKWLPTAADFLRCQEAGLRCCIGLHGLKPSRPMQAGCCCYSTVAGSMQCARRAQALS